MSMDASSRWNFDEHPFAAIGGYGQARLPCGGEKMLDRLIVGFNAEVFGQAVGEPEGARAGELGWRALVIRQCEAKDEAGSERRLAASIYQGLAILEQENTPFIAMMEAQDSTPGLEEPTRTFPALGKMDAGLCAASAPAFEHSEQIRPTVVIR